MDLSISTLAQFDAAVRPLRESSQLLATELEGKIEQLQTEVNAKQQRGEKRGKVLRELKVKAEELNQQV